MKQIIKEIKTWKALYPVRREWEKLRARERLQRKTCLPRRVFIVPCDPWTFSGSKGDEAMIQAVVGQLCRFNPSLAIGTVTATSAASLAARSMGFDVEQVWDAGLTATIDALEKYQPDAVVVLGADCMDGYYSPLTSFRLLVTADISARLGYHTTITGFSFNDKPSRHLRSAFNAASDRLSLNVRDPISFERFRNFCHAHAQLVADAAFMLQAQPDSEFVRKAAAWAERERAAGRKILAFNIHPMLIRNASDQELLALNEKAIEALNDTFKSNQEVSLMLMAHDYRGNDGDDRCLDPIWRRLSATHGSRVHYTKEPLSAAELKGMSGLADGLITGRMHLAIAALGMGVPVAVITYQDKFQGLLKHFGFADALHVSPSEILTSDALRSLTRSFVNRLSELRDVIKARLPDINKLSEMNIQNLVGKEDVPDPIIFEACGEGAMAVGPGLDDISECRRA